MSAKNSPSRVRQLNEIGFFSIKKINKINSYVTLCGKRITTSLKSISRIKMPVVDFSSF